MIICPKCHKELKEGTKFCDNCGTKIIETAFCPNCGKPTSSEFAFCQNCGASLAGGVKKPSATGSKIKRKGFKKPILFGGIGAAVIVVLIAAISLIFGGGNKNNSALYVKDQEIFFTDLKKDSETWQVTSGFFDVELDKADEQDIANSGDSLGAYIHMSEDGKYIFFPDKVMSIDFIFNSAYSFNLYYREVGKPEADTIKIDSYVRSYAVNTSATIVTYVNIKGDLYQYHITEDFKDKIASDVKDFDISCDGNKIVYDKTEGGIYVKYVDKDSEKISSGAYLEYVTDDLKTVYYIDNHTLYKNDKENGEVKIASDVYRVLKIYNSGEIYYLTSKSKEVPIMDYIIDDMQDDMQKIDQATLFFNDLRNALKEETVEQTDYSLCFYNGMEEVVITDTYVQDSYDSYTVATDTPVIEYKAYDRSGIKKIKLSEIENVYNTDIVQAVLYASSESYVAVKDVPTLIEQQTKADNFKINSSGTVVYYMDNILSSNDHGELYRIFIDDGVVGKSELYDNDVYANYCDFVNDDRFQYFKDCNEVTGELYINKNKIGSDVFIENVINDSDSDRVFYFTDWNDERQCGALTVYQNAELVTIADEVHDCSINPGGQVLYLCDYSLNSYRGELHQWNSGKEKKIDDDVTCIISVAENKYNENKWK